MCREGLGRLGFEASRLAFEGLGSLEHIKIDIDQQCS